ncbi:MAG: alpha-hydroxy-acid oxidizing protein [Nitrososphaerota archaeon]|nr:alpha-hydroxy-acid oxidizing protein [Nitrososphaerota archaeon]
MPKRTRVRKVTRFPVSYEGWAIAAEKAVKPGPFSYLHAPGGEGMAQRANYEAFYKWRLIPRVLRDMSRVDISVTLFGSRIPAPILLAPVGSQTMYHPRGELESSTAAASKGIPFILSTYSSKTIEDVAKAMGDSTRWFQLYPSSEPEINASLLHRAKSSGYTAVVMTVDRGRYPQYELIPDYKPTGTANYYSDPVFLSRTEKFRGKEEIQEYLTRVRQSTSFSWSDLDFVKRESGLPVILKGIVNPKDAELALTYDVDGLIVSNHGARHQDGVCATMDALPEVLEIVQGKIPVLLDSGIRGGVYAVKALALGASAVDFGHLYIYALSVGGEAGVRKVIENLISEMEVALAFCGCTSISELDRSVIRRYD